ncbi:hypothetical protein PM027_17845 [[Clostridium] symbiosum]|nr:MULTISPECIES: hypothetical protein [Lachnospiraceae]MDB2019916.1 hypothetical protein [[Clostridium] symbiosum]
MPDRNGKIFYTSITSLSHISKVTGNQAACRRWWRCPDRHDPCSAAVRAAGITPCVLKNPPRPL